MRKFYVIIIFICFNCIIIVFDLIIFIPYFIFIYVYLLSPLYYIIFYILSYIRFLLPFLIVYFVMSYNYKSYRQLKFFWISLIPLKFRINYYLNTNKSFELFYYIFWFGLLFIFIYSFFEEIFWLNFFFMIWIIIYLNWRLFKWLKNWNLSKINLYINLFLILLISNYINLFIHLHSSLESTFEVENIIWELNWFKLTIKYFAKWFIELRKLKEAAEEGILRKIWRFITENQENEETKQEKFIYKYYIHSRYVWLYSDLLKSYTTYLNQYTLKFDEYWITTDYDQFDLSINWSYTNLIIKNIDKWHSTFMLSMDNINNEDFIFERMNYLRNPSPCNPFRINKTLQIQDLNVIYNYNMYIELMWDEMNTFRHFLASGLNYPLENSMKELSKRNQVNLQLLNGDISLSLDDNKYLYSKILDDILWNRYNNYSLQKINLYYNLYYNKSSLFNSELENFFLNYLKNFEYYFDLFNMVYNECFIDNKLNDMLFIYYDNKTLLSQDEINFKDETNLRYLFASSLLTYSNTNENLLNNSFYKDKFFNKQKLFSYNLLQMNKNERDQFLKLEKDLIDNTEYYSIPILLEKKDKLYCEDEGENLDFDYYSSKHITPANVAYEDYWRYKFNKYNINYEELYNYILVEELKKQKEQEEKEKK